ncbi:hypothetical protein BMON_1910 [Bifidobacterium mongoliense DSM 21395]|uniref:Uncharacterized protein n=1 Tax=Bifidobacterium mongoliense DSM 21395 TaxID=1437603 RepID=A0A087C059_9BIFI|nr:hypothetical protein BMON_1910 [Bifidobacterium mongoliense DSM 21395]
MHHKPTRGRTTTVRIPQGPRHHHGRTTARVRVTAEACTHHHDTQTSRGSLRRIFYQ